MNELVKNTIQKQLLSFDDIEFDKSTDTNQKVSKTIKDWQWVQDNFVDLGLPSGTLWMKYNLGATCGNTAESWYGHRYMWGSSKPNENDECCWKNAPFNNGANDFDNAYFNKHMHEFVDQNSNLLPEHDAAYQENHLMHIPTIEQVDELKALPNKWVENYNGVNGLNGRVFTGTNDNKLFIPAAGWFYETVLDKQGFYCYLWSSRLYADYPGSAYYFNFYSGSINIFSTSRCTAFPVRPVLY